jgi:predicted unusual protein kinase regulating ubiquinone biosynthesis (AarF/ABC1/UbiB family)
MGLVPEEIRPEFQEILAELQHSAKPSPFKDVRKIVEADLGAPISGTAVAANGVVYVATMTEIWALGK